MSEIKKKGKEMRKKLSLAVTFLLGVAITLVATKLNHPQPVHAYVVDPYYIVHQVSPGGPISVYSTSDPAVVNAVANTPDGKCDSSGETCYIVGTPYLTTAVQALENKLYIGK